MNIAASKFNAFNACTFFLCVQALFLCVPVALSSDADLKKSEELPYITHLLLHAESKRLNNPKVFSSELNSLSEHQPLMSKYQLCHFQFLKNYQISYQGKYQKAIKSLEKLLTECDDLRAQIRINAMLANIYVNSGQFEKSIINMDAVIENANQTDDKPSKIMAYSVASIVYNLLKQTQLSQEYSQLLYRTEPNSSNLCKANYYKIRSALVTKDELFDAETVEATVEECFTTNNALMAHMLQLNYYRYQLENEATNIPLVYSIKHHLNDIESAISDTEYQYIQALYFAIKSLASLHLQQLDEAEQLANQVLDINESIGDSEPFIIALNVLEEVSILKHDYAKSYEYLSIRSDTEKKIFDLNQSKQIAFMTVKHANLAKTFEIEQLNQNKLLLELENKLADKKASNQTLLLVLIISLMTLLTLWSYRIKKKHDYFKDVSEIDHLTKVNTRKAFDEQMKSLLGQAKKQNKPVHLAIMDLDYFKMVNDLHGHLVGDWVLKNIVYACKQLAEEGMMIARLGGEEFCIVYMGVDQVVMNMKLEDMRSAVEQLDCSVSGAESLQVTASFGVCSSLHSGYHLPTLLKHADVALFEAKKMGKNQVVQCTEING